MFVAFSSLRDRTAFLACLELGRLATKPRGRLDAPVVNAGPGPAAPALIRRRPEC